MKKILEYVKDDRNWEVKSGKEEVKVVDFMEDFLEQYQCLFHLYGQLKGELRDKVEGRNNSNGSSPPSSFSSESEQHHSTKEPGSESQVSQLELKSKQNGDENVALIKEFENGEKEAIANLTKLIINLEMDVDYGRAQNEELRRELKLLHIRKTESEMKLKERRTEEMGDHVILVNHLQSKITEQQRMLEDMDRYKELAEEGIFEMANKSMGVVARVNALKQQLASLKHELNMEKQSGTSLKDYKKDAETKMEEMAKEFTMKVEDRFHLLSRRVFIVEQLHAETEEKHEQTCQLHQEKLPDKSQPHKNELKTLEMDNISDIANSIFTESDMVINKLMEGSRILMSRISNVSNEIRLARTRLLWVNYRGGKWLEEEKKLRAELQEVRRKESALSSKALHLAVTKQVVQFEKYDMEQRLTQQQIKMGELEKVIREKDQIIWRMAEEKREAIKQLCMWSDQYRHQLDQYKEMLSNLTGRKSRLKH